MSILPKLVSPTVLLYIYVIIMQIARGVYLTGKIESAPAYEVIDFVGLFWILGWWLLTDSRKRGIAWVYDMGFFLSIAWVFVMPYYLLKTRGAKGLLLILAFICVYFGAILVGGTLYLVIALSTGRVTIG